MYLMCVLQHGGLCYLLAFAKYRESETSKHYVYPPQTAMLLVVLDGVYNGLTPGACEKQRFVGN